MGYSVASSLKLWNFCKISILKTNTGSKEEPHLFFVTILLAKDFFYGLTKALPVYRIPKTMNASYRSGYSDADGLV